MTANNPQCRTPVRPQNPGYPAGGTINRPLGQRGVIVAPPSGNTDDKENPMIALHKGFDTLIIAIQANIPPDLFAHLEKEKARAEDERREVLCDFNGVQFHLKSHGGNGYRFIASGGPDGAMWFFKKPNSKDKWGIRVSFGSYFMALHGLANARLHLEQVLDRLGVRFGEGDVSISRVDFCVDILAPEFTLVPECFVMHSATGRRDHLQETSKAVHGKSGRTTSVTIGSPRNRQVIIYDKRAEIIHSGKAHWWSIWNHILRLKGLPLLTPDNPATSRVWRVEFRAGKDLLKDRWGIRTWAQLYTNFGDLCREAGEVVRYTDPPLKEVHKETHISLISRQVLGSVITLAALNGKTQQELPEFLQKTAHEMSQDVIKSPEKVRKQLQCAKDRYVFIHPDKRHA